MHSISLDIVFSIIGIKRFLSNYQKWKLFKNNNIISQKKTSWKAYFHIYEKTNHAVFITKHTLKSRLHILKCPFVISPLLRSRSCLPYCRTRQKNCIKEFGIRKYLKPLFESSLIVNDLYSSSEYRKCG